MKVDTLYDIGNVVYLRCRDERLKGMITQILIDGSISYLIVWGTGSSSWHEEFEISIHYIPDYKEA